MCRMRGRELLLAAGAVLISGGMLAFFLWGPGLGRSVSEVIAQARGAVLADFALFDELAQHVRRANAPCARVVRASHVGGIGGSFLWDVRCSSGSNWRLLVEYDHRTDGSHLPRTAIVRCEALRHRPRCWEGPDKRPVEYAFT
jgi:hypothetical protein